MLIDVVRVWWSDKADDDDDDKPSSMMRMPMLGVVVDGLLVYADAVRYRFYSTEQVGYKLLLSYNS